MIKSKTDYKNYILEDKKALHVPSNRKSPRPFLDSIWRYEIRLRKCEYYKNVSGFMHKFLYAKIMKNNRELFDKKDIDKIYPYKFEVKQSGRTTVLYQLIFNDKSSLK